MSSYNSDNSGSFGLAPPSPIIPRHPLPVPGYITHNFNQAPNYQLQPYTHAQFLNFNHQPVFGDESSFGPPEITPADTLFDEVNDRIGRGSYGTVYRAQCRSHEVAVKIPHQQQISDADLKSFQEEVRMMSKLNHPNIIRLMGACTVPGRLQIVTERCVGDLEGLLSDPSYKGDLCETLKMARDTAKGMAWLHDVSKIIHGDLKPANLLIDSNGQIKITDFGFSQFKKDYPVENATTRGTLIWMAPEKMLRRPFTEKVDVFSFGIILWEMVTKHKPYQHHSDPAAFCKAICYSKERPLLSTDIPASLQVLMTSCWDDNPDKRLSFREIFYKLNSILVDCVIGMPHAANFWKLKFLQREDFERVELPVFRSALKEELGNHEDSFFFYIENYLVKEVNVGGKDTKVVTMEKFDLVTKWFGPFYMSEPGAAIISEINNLAQQPWFHGDISSEKTGNCLSGKPRGTFLVRLSFTDPLNFPFTLSLPKNVNMRMQRTPEGLTVQKEVYPSLEYFVQKK